MSAQPTRTVLLYELYKMMVKALVNYKVLYKCGLFISVWLSTSGNLHSS